MRKSGALLRTLRGIGVVSAALGLVALGFGVIAQKEPSSEEERWTDTFPIEEFSSVGVNRFFILRPGYFLILEGIEDGKNMQLTITVLNQTRTVDGAETRIVEERERNITDNKLVEISRNFFAIGKKTNSVYYFGEEVDVYRNGQIVSHEGAWRSGTNGARFGVLMPGITLLGARYYQEIAPGIAMDRAENISLTESLETPAGSFKNCLRVKETTPLEPGVTEFKIYAEGIGLIQDNMLKLVRYGNRQ